MAKNEISVGVVSDTHGMLSDALLAELATNDYIVHAGDICSTSNYDSLCNIAPLYACLGNNDGRYLYGPHVGKITRFVLGGLRWQVCHYRELLDLASCDIAICGHTHRPFVEHTKSNVLVMNPGSPTYPRTMMGPTCGKIVVSEGKIISADIVLLD